MANRTHTNRRRFLKTSGALVTLGSLGLAGCTQSSSGGGSTPTSTPAPQPTSGGGGETAGGGGKTTTTPSLQEQANPPSEIVAVNFPVNGMEKIWYAMDAGYFKDRGLNVTLTPKPVFGGANGVKAVLSGKADIACTVPIANPLNLARTQNIYFKLLWGDAFLDYQDGWMDSAWFILPKDSDVSSFTDLKGKRIVTLNGASVLNVDARYAADQAGLDPMNDIEIGGVPIPQVGGAVARKEAAAGVWLDPRILNAIEKGIGIKRWKPSHGWLSPGIVDGFWVHPDFADKYPATTKLLQQVLQQVNKDLLDDSKREQIWTVAQQKGNIEKSVYETLWKKKYIYKPAPQFEDMHPLRSIQRNNENLLKYTKVSGQVDPKQLLLPWNRP